MSTMNNTPLLIKLSILTLFLLHSATSSYPSHSSPSPSPSSSPFIESPQSPSPSSPSPTQSFYSPPAPPSQSLSPTSESAPAYIPTPPPVTDTAVTNAESMNYVTEANKKSSGGNGVGVAFGLIGAACVVIFGGAVYKKRRDNIRRSRRYSAANIQLI